MKGCKVKNQKHQFGSAHLVIIVVLSLALIGALGFVFWQNFMQPKEITTQANSVVKSTTEDKVEQISQNELEAIVTSELGFLNGKTSLDQVTNQEKLHLAITLYAKAHPSASGVYVRTITASEVDNTLSRASISTDGLVHESIKCTAATTPVHNEYDYDSKTKTYSNANHGGHGIEKQISAIYSKASNFKQDNNQFSITYKYVFGVLREFGAGDSPIFGTYSDAENETNAIHVFKAANDEIGSSVSIDDQKSYIENNYNSFENKLSAYTYTFKKTDGKIKLVDFSVK